MNAHDSSQSIAADERVSRKRLVAAAPLALTALLLGPRSADAAADSRNAQSVIGGATKSLLFKTKKKVRMRISAKGDVGIGRVPSGARLHVASPADGPSKAIAAEAKATNGTGVVGIAPNSLATALAAIGVDGQGTAGVRGTGEYFGVEGSSLNYAVFGVTTPDTGGIGVYGRGLTGVKGRSYAGNAVLGDTDSGVAVKGEAYSDGGAVKAVHGKAFGSNANGVVGEASVGASAYGIWGISTTGYAGVFSGKALVTGNLSKGGGAFKIDHPLDPENKYLYHSFVESPDMMNVYNGNVTTDASGEAVVELPDWFEALNRDFRYQLTVIGEFAQAIVRSGVEGNRFTIATDKPNIEVSWQVTGIRQDAFANANRIQVEEDKEADERGLFLHPAEHGRPERLGVQHARIAAASYRRATRVTDPVVPAR